MTTPCTFPDCGRPSRRRGLCHTHYEQHRMGVTLKPIRSTTRRPCTVDGCTAPSRALGLCHAHYQRLQTGRPLDGPIARRGPRTTGPSRADAARIEAMDGRQLIATHAQIRTLQRAIDATLARILPDMAGQIRHTLDAAGMTLRDRLDQGRRA